MRTKERLSRELNDAEPRRSAVLQYAHQRLDRSAESTQVLEYQGAEHCNPRAGRAGVYHVARRSTDDLRASHERRRAEYFSWLATILLTVNEEPHVYEQVWSLAP